jgi:hypothetical protein
MSAGQGSRLDATVLVLDDKQYETCWGRVESGEKHLVKDKSLLTHTFFRQGNQMLSEREDGLIQRVIPKCQEADFMKAHRPFKETMVERLREDYPELGEDDLNAHADVLKEANDTILRLIQAGMTPEKAKHLVVSILECEKPPGSAEEIAALWRGADGKDAGLKPSDDEEVEENGDIGASCGNP